MYPHPSRNRITVNRKTIWGRKTITAPTPRITPSASNRVHNASGRTASNQSARPSISPDRRSIAGVAQVKIAWKKRATNARKTVGPSTGWSRKRSSRLVQWSVRGTLRRHRSSIPYAQSNLCSGVSATAGPRSAADGAQSEETASRAPRSSMPRPRLPTTPSTGTPSAAPRAFTSISPCAPSTRRSSSERHRAALRGSRPSTISGRARSIVVAARTTTTPSGGGSPNSPRRTRTATASSSDWGSRLYTPGRSIRRTGTSVNRAWRSPSRRSTVTPG